MIIPALRGYRLGLSLVKGLAELHAAILRSAAAEGEGTVIVVTIPSDASGAIERECADAPVTVEFRRD